ncbi:type II toxin-antitoxin system RelB/DinJ family antitoxin [Aerococcaceae bacterium zg-B36]|uniref:type II toxin-antitoxin system RelB/DinJ family antitoxin n=1 Tax=Aerococcaceae bacterium zg-252 TaxID=2796928 RepID=UPI001BD85689|nr:type II toxin-antitoxin system RelB/DinJ family antitoxin [Aerococcaceae bacterium zg-B36]
MANTNAVYARIDSNLKQNAETILRQLGISPSSAIQMLYHQIILHNGMPFELRLPERKPTSISKLSQEDLNIELQKALDSLASGKTYSADEVDDFISKEYGI